MSPQQTGDGSAPPKDAGDRAPPEDEANVADASTDALNDDSADATKTGPSGRQANYKWVGSQVRRMYDSVLNEPVPKNFTELLKQAYDSKKTPEKS